MSRWKNSIRQFAAVLALSTVLVLLSGCGEETVRPPDQPAYIDANLIICNPLAPAPGDLATLTLQAEGLIGGGTARYRWFVEVGTFFDPDPSDNIAADEGISVLWQVPPDTSGVFRVIAVASVEGDIDSIQKPINVRYFVAVDTGRRVSLYPNLIGAIEGLFFAGSNTNPADLSFVGFNVFRKNPASGSTNITDCTDCRGGDDFVFHPTALLGSMVTRYFVSYRQQLMNVWKIPLYIGVDENISDDYGLGINQRRNQHVVPNGNASFDLIVWQKNIVGEASDGTKDLFNIAFWNSTGYTRTLTTSLDSTTAVIGPDTVTLYRYYKNVKPTFTPDERYIVYFVDTTGTFEPCLIPMEGNIPDRSKRAALMLDEFDGIFSQAGVEFEENTIFEWNPDPTKNLLGFIDGDNILCFFYPDTLPLGNVVRFDELDKISEFAWSPGGDTCAVVTEEGAAIISLSGVPILVFTKEKSTDELVGLNWSTDPDSNDPKLAFRMIRKGKGVEDSYSSVIIWSLNDDEWYYATPRVSWRAEPPVDYKWMRIVFQSDNSGIYVPIPVGSSGDITIYHSYE